MRASDGVAQSVEVARGYAGEAVACLEPYGDAPAAVALRGAAQHLVASL